MKNFIILGFTSLSFGMGLPPYLNLFLRGSSVESCNIGNGIHNFLAGLELSANGSSYYSQIYVSLNPQSYEIPKISTSLCEKYNQRLNWYVEQIEQFIRNQEPFTVDFNHPKSLLNERNIEKIRELLDASPDVDDKQDLETLYARILAMHSDLLPYQAPTRSISSVFSALKSLFQFG